MTFFKLMSLLCPLCHCTIAKDDINVSTDLAMCRACGETLSFSELVGVSVRAAPDLAAPPAGAWFEHISGGFRLGASTRSWMGAFYIPFTCVWSGGSLSGIYGKQFASGHFDPSTSLFGLPFLIGTFFLIGMCAMTVAGKVELSQTEDRLSVFTGIGMVGWSRTYAWSDFSTVREDASRGFNRNRMGQTAIVLEGKRRLAFGSLLSENRRYFVLSALRKMLRDANRTHSFAIKKTLLR